MRAIFSYHRVGRREQIKFELLLNLVLQSQVGKFGSHLFETRDLHKGIEYVICVSFRHVRQ